MYLEQETETTLSTSTLSAQISALSSCLLQIDSRSVDSDAELIEELTELLRALESLKQCLEYKPLQCSDDGKRTWTHDFRNHLNAVKGFAELCKEDKNSEHLRLNNLLEDILKQADQFLQQSVLCSPQPSNTLADLSAQTAERTGTVLVIEDHPDNRALLVRILHAQGHQVIQAATAAEAFEQLAKHKIELILLDLILPDQNGFDVLHRLKHNAAQRSIPVIMISGQQEHDEAVRCIQAGAEDYLFKPVNQILLKARIDASLERKSWRDREQQYVNELAQSHSFIRKTFGRYTSEEIVDRLLEDPRGLELGGRQQEVTVVMTDISGFTTLCDSLEPQQVVQLLNNYLGTLSEVILANHGTIDEFIGDAILAIFGAPFPANDDADRALNCAIAMQRAMKQVNLKNKKSGLPEIETAIAINTGTVVAGNIGSERRTKFAIVGQPVNMTARIEEITKPNQILVAESTIRALCEPIELGESQQLLAKGITEPITLYDIPHVLEPEFNA